MIDVLFLGFSVMVVAIVQRSYTKDDPKRKVGQVGELFEASVT
jgi:hypothetical protein